MLRNSTTADSQSAKSNKTNATTPLPQPKLGLFDKISNGFKQGLVETKEIFSPGSKQEEADKLALQKDFTMALDTALIKCKSTQLDLMKDIVTLKEKITTVESKEAIELVKDVRRALKGKKSSLAGGMIERVNTEDYKLFTTYLNPELEKWDVSRRKHLATPRS